MKKKLLDLTGARELNKKEKKAIKGGLACMVDSDCRPGQLCYGNFCRC